jgi:hypothetical protein
MTNTGPAQGTERRQPPEPADNAKTRVPQGISAGRRVPFFRLLLFYAVLISIASALIYYFPLVRHAWVSSPLVEGGAAFPKLGERVLAQVQDRGTLERTASVFLITIGALALSMPVAWVYTFTRRLRYDPSLVHSIIILPMVVSGIVVVVKDSVALAFSLAGIVAVVRFRNTLKDPKDAAYIFLALGIGLAAGVQALDIALVLSFVFNFIVLILWKYNPLSMYGDSSRDLLSIGNSDLLIARSASAREKIRWRLSDEAPDQDTDGILLVHSHDTEAAKQRVELTLSKIAEHWHIADNFRRRNGVSTFAVLLKLKDKKSDPLSMLADIDERWSQDIPAAEYVPLQKSGKHKQEAS